MDDDATADVTEQPLQYPASSVLSFLIYRLAKVIGTIQEKCFGLERASYDAVLGLDRDLGSLERNSCLRTSASTTQTSCWTKSSPS